MICESNNKPVEFWRDEAYGLPGVYKKKKSYDLLVKATFNGSIWNRIYKRSMLVEQGIHFDSKLKTLEDVIFSVRTILLARGIVVTNANYFYLRRCSSTMSRVDDDFIFSWLFSYEQVIAVLNCAALPKRVYLACIKNCQNHVARYRSIISSQSSIADYNAKWSEIETKLKYTSSRHQSEHNHELKILLDNLSGCLLLGTR